MHGSEAVAPPCRYQIRLQQIASALARVRRVAHEECDCNNALQTAEISRLRRLHRPGAALLPPPPRPAPSRPQRDGQRTKLSVEFGNRRCTSVYAGISGSDEYLPAQLHVLIAAARVHDAVAEDEREGGAASSSRAVGEAVDGGWMRHIVAVAETKLTEAVAAQAP